MNQYRCETCKTKIPAPNWKTDLNGAKFECPYNEAVSFSLDNDRLALIEVRGCASHSDFQSEREELSLTSTDLLLISHDEWKRREERKHIHDRVDWTAGWISGFLTSRKFVKDRIAELRQKASE